MQRLTITWNCFKETYDKSISNIYAIFFDLVVVLVYKISDRACCICSVRVDSMEFHEFEKNYIQYVSRKCDDIEDAIAFIELENE